MKSAPDVLATTRDLIAIPSVNPMGAALSASRPGEGPIVEHVASLLQLHRIDFQLYETAHRRPTLLASVDVGSPRVLLLEAHADTVPVEGMTIPPFEPSIHHGLIHGRGACDTKSSLAAFLCAVLHAAESNSLRTNVLLAITADEESMQLGARALVSEGIRATAAIVGEPTSLALVRAHKGVCQFRLTTRGRSAHASVPELGDNAIVKMASALALVSEYSRGLVERPDPDLGVSTLNIGTISGGTGANMVPAHCEVEIDRRLVAGETAQSCTEDVRRALAVLGDDAPIVNTAFLELPPLVTAPTSPAVQGLGRVLEAMRLSARPVVANFGTDAALYSRAGIPSVVFGPGSIAHAHTAAEFCPTDEIYQAFEVVRRLISGE